MPETPTTHRRDDKEATEGYLERMRLAVEASKLGIWDYNPQTYELQWSNRMKDMLGIAHDRMEIRLQILLDCIHPDDSQRVQLCLDHHLVDKEPYEIEYRIRRDDTGETRWLSVVGDSIWDADGRPLRSLGSCYDITERKLVELRLEESERRAREAELAQREAEAINKTRNRFLTNLSHELRTPLTGIISAAELLREVATDEGRAQDVKDINVLMKSSERLARMLDDLLILTQLEAGSLTLQVSRYAVGPVLADVAQIMRAEAERNGNTRAIAVDPSVNAGRADHVRLKQCLLNLLSNAVKFTADGVISVSATIGLGEKQAELVIAVHDNGAGISPDQLPFLFEPMLQAKGSGVDPRSGAGLGLAITKRLTELMGGRIEVKSELGAGSCFTLHLPLIAKATG